MQMICLLIAAVLFLKEFVHAGVLALLLDRYMKKHRYLVWRDIHTIDGLGVGVNNPFRYLHWLRTHESGDDEMLLRQKDTVWKHLRRVFLLFALIVGNILIISVLSFLI